MYQIFADGKLLYAPNLVSEGYAVISPKLTLELNKAGSLTFTLPPNNVMYDSISKLKTIITVFDDSDQIFRGRVLHDEKDYYNRKEVYCEGELAFLLDSIVRTYDFQGSPSDLFKKYITEHNEQVDADKQFTIGQVDIADNNNYVHYSSTQYPKTLYEFNSKLIDTHGGYVRTKNQVIDYVQDFGEYSDQIIQFGENLLDISEYISADDVFTILIPLGAEQEDEDGNKTGRLTITSVNGGLDYIQDTNAISIFGKITRTETWDDVTEPSNLLTKGKSFLADGIEMAVTLTIKAVDLHLINVNTSRIKLGQYIRVLSIPHKLDKYFQCSKMTVDMVSPDKSEFTLGVGFTAMTENQVKSSKQIQNAVSSISDVSSAVQAVAITASEAKSEAGSASHQVIVIGGQIPTDYVKTETFEVFQEEVNQKIASVYTVKGSVSSESSLPTYNRNIGDVWNVLDTGANYVWTDSGWDKLSETIDLSEYAKKTDIPTKVSELENDAGYVTNEQIPTDYVKTETFEVLVARVQALEQS